MKVSRAPVYIRAFDLATWLLARSDAFPQTLPSGVTLAAQIQADASVMLNGVALALTFRTERRQRLQRVNEVLLELRMTLRLAQSRKLLQARQVRHAMKAIDEIGRMVGGWLKHELGDPPRLE